MAAALEQARAEQQRARNRGAIRAAIGRAGDFRGDRLRAGKAIDQPPRQQDFLIVGIGPFEVSHRDARVNAGLERGEEFRRGQRGDVTLALERLLVRVHGIGHVDREDELHVDIVGVGPLRSRLRRRRRTVRRVCDESRERPAQGEHRQSGQPRHAVLRPAEQRWAVWWAETSPGDPEAALPASRPNHDAACIVQK